MQKVPHAKGAGVAKEKFEKRNSVQAEGQCRVLNLRLSLTHQIDDFPGPVSILQALAQFRVTEKPNQPSQDGQVLGDGGGNDQKKKASRKGIGRIVCNSFRMPAKNHKGSIHQTNQGVTGVRKRDAVPNSGAMQLFALVQSPEEGLASLGLVRQFRDLVYEFVQDRLAISALQIQLDACRREQLVQNDRP